MWLINQERVSLIKYNIVENILRKIYYKIKKKLINESTPDIINQQFPSTTSRIMNDSISIRARKNSHITHIHTRHILFR